MCWRSAPRASAGPAAPGVRRDGAPAACARCDPVERGEMFAIFRSAPLRCNAVEVIDNAGNEQRPSTASRSALQKNRCPDRAVTGRPLDERLARCLGEVLGEGVRSDVLVLTALPAAPSGSVCARAGVLWRIARKRAHHDEAGRPIREATRHHTRAWTRMIGRTSARRSGRTLTPLPHDGRSEKAAARGDGAASGASCEAWRGRRRRRSRLETRRSSHDQNDPQTQQGGVRWPAPSKPASS